MEENEYSSTRVEIYFYYETILHYVGYQSLDDLEQDNDLSRKFSAVTIN